MRVPASVIGFGIAVGAAGLSIIAAVLDSWELAILAMAFSIGAIVTNVFFLLRSYRPRRGYPRRR